MFRKPILPLVLLLAVVLSSCIGRYKLSRSALSESSAWPSERADIAASGSIAGDNYSGGLEPIWQRKVSDRPVGPLVISHNHLAVPGSRKRVWFFDCQTGSKLGKLKAGGIPQGGIMVSDSLAYITLAFPRDKLLCADLVHRQTRWQVRIKDAAFGPIIVDNRLITSSSDGVVTAFDPKTGKQFWRIATENRLLGPVSAARGRVFVGSSDGLLFAISALDGKEIYRVNLKGPIVSAVAIADYIYVANAEGQLFALAQQDGVVAWKVSLPSSTWTAPTVSDGRVIVACRNGDIAAYDGSTGSAIWKYAAVDVVKASPIVVGKFVVVGTMTGKLLTLTAGTGELVSQATLDGAIAYSPVSDGSHVYVVTQTGRVHCFGDLHEQRKQANH